MRTFVFASLLMSGLVSGCVTVPMGGTGQTTSGEAIFGEVLLGLDQNVLSLKSLDGLSCSGSYKKNNSTALRTIPLACTNGKSGTAVMTVNAPTAEVAFQTATVSFRLSDGTKGNVRFGLNS